MKYQKGFYDLDLTPIFILAVVGLIAVIIGVPYAIYWLWNHVVIAIV